MKTKLLSALALIFTSFTPAALSTFVSTAAAEPTDGSFCQLNNKQISNGWTCDEEAQGLFSRSLGIAVTAHGLGFKCQDFGTIGYTGVNPGGQEDPDHTFSSDVQSLGHLYYSDGFWCNYPIQ